MVFKGVEGVVPSAGTLKGLWEGSTTVNDQDTSARTITKSPDKVYKSKLAESWNDLLVDMVWFNKFKISRNRSVESS